MKILIVLMLFCLSAMAGHESGNGGDGIYCPENSKVTLLDYYEQELFLGHGDEWQKAAFAINRLSRLNPTRARLYSEGLSNFLAETKFVRGTVLPDIPDQGDIYFPRNCELRQLAIQKTNQYGMDNYNSWNVFVPERYTIDADMWDIMSTDDRAGLILHELIYREAANILGHSSSKYVRKLNQLISSYDVTGMDEAGFRRVVAFDLTFARADLKRDGYVFPLKHIYVGNGDRVSDVYHSNGALAEAYIDGITFKNGRAYYLNKVFLDTFGKVEGFSFNQEFKSDAIPFGSNEYQFTKHASFGGVKVAGPISNEVLLSFKEAKIRVTGNIEADNEDNFYRGTVIDGLKDSVEAGTYEVFPGGHLALNSGAIFAYDAKAQLKGIGEDKFILSKGSFSLTPHSKRLKGFYGDGHGVVHSCAGSDKFWKVSQRFDYFDEAPFTPQMIGQLNSEVSCLGKDKITYPVKTEISLDSECRIIREQSIPLKAFPCVIK